MKELGLQLLKPRLGLLMLRKIADEAGEVGHSAGLHLADRKMHRKRRSVFALSGYDSANADDMPLAGGSIARQVAIVARTVGVWHQDADILADSLLLGVTKLPLRSTAEELHDAAAVDNDHRIRNSLQDGAKVTFPCSQRFFDLLLLVDIDHDAAEVTWDSLLIPYHTASCTNPMARLRLCPDSILHIETAAGLDRSLYGLFCWLAVLRFKKGKE